MASCTVCSDLDPEFFSIGSYVDSKRWAITWSDLIASAQGGCPACSVLYSGIQTCTDDLESFQTIHLYYRNKKEPLKVALKSTDIHEKQDIYLQFYTLGGEPSVWPIIGSAGHFSADPACEDVLTRALCWLQTCISCAGLSKESHGACPVLKLEALPDRVLYIGTDKEDPHLHISSGARAHYAALSYPWGSTSPLKTTRKSLESHMRGIALFTLPQTFQDAIFVARELGFEYIWIDSLCILQDDEDDWALQSSKMGKIFQNSQVAIAAAAASDSHSGFLQKRQFSRPLGRSHCRGPRGTESVVYSRHEPITLQRGAYTYGEPDPAELSHRYDFGPHSHLTTRGWVFQERMLAPRTLFFGSDEMSFECHSQIDCECTQTGQRRPRVDSFGKAFLKSQDVAKWEEMIEHFTALNLTIPTDRLAALSGIAAAWAGHRLNMYIGGLWSRHLPRSLAWRISTSSKHERRCSRKQSRRLGPSWSWASITGIVQFGGPYYKPHPSARLLEYGYSSTATGGNPFDLAKDAYLKISGLMMPVKLSRGSEYLGYQIAEDGPGNEVLSTWLVVPDVQCTKRKGNGKHETLWARGEDTVQQLDSAGESSQYAQVKSCCIGNEELEDTARQYFFFLLGEKNGSVHGLVIARCKDRECFERIGYAMTFAKQQRATERPSDWAEWSAKATMMEFKFV